MRRIRKSRCTTVEIGGGYPQAMGRYLSILLSE